MYSYWLQNKRDACLLVKKKIIQSNSDLDLHGYYNSDNLPTYMLIE